MFKQKLKILFSILVLTSLVAFKVGDHVELEAYLNARSSSQFLKTSPNLVTTLAAQTKGEVREIKQMKSGNYGIKMLVENGPHKGESYWVYYNVKKPQLKLLDGKNNEVRPEAKTEPKDQVKSARLTASQSAIRDPEEATLVVAAKTAQSVLEDKTKTTVSLPSLAKNCNVQMSELSSDVTASNYTESDVVAPFNEKATSSLHSILCQGQPDGWDRCINKEDKKVEAFKLTNHGPNPIVKSNEYYINREFSFDFEDQARSDMKLIVSDAIDDTTSHTTYSVMAFFPRTVLPAVKKVGEELHVTLPNREIVRFNAKTKEVIGGVFTEGPMEALSNKKARPANINYTGNGVMIRTDKSGDLPHGDIEGPNGTSLPSTSTAIISKRGYKDCQVKSREIWYTDNNKGGNVFIRPEFASDKGFDAFIVKRCGFSMY